MNQEPISTAADQSCCRERLLDAAERLFAQNGIAETSVRAITGEAGANVAAINYYFGSRRGLFQAVVARRLVTLDDKRKALLAGFQAASGGKASAEEVLQALVAPSIELCFEHPYFARLISQIRLNHDQSLWDDYRADRADRAGRAEQVQLFRDAFAAALPQLSAQEIDTRQHYVLGAIHYIWSQCPLPESETPQLLLASFLTFYAAGLRAPGSGE